MNPTAPPREAGAAAIVVAAGRGTRFGPAAKTLAPLAGRPLLAWTLDALEAAASIATVTIVTGPHTAAATEALLAAGGWRKPDHLALGGARRQDSVAAGLAAAPAADIVVIHDGARPLAPAALFDACVAAAREHGAAIAAVPVSDTLKLVSAERIVRTVDRAGLWAAQTPQAFRRDLLVDLFARAADVTLTDEAALCEAFGIPVAIVPGSPSNLKITQLDDLAVAEALLTMRREDGEMKRRGDEESGVQGNEAEWVEADHSMEIAETSGAFIADVSGAAATPTPTPSSHLPDSRPPTHDSSSFRLPRTGIGYDVHRFAAGRRLVLGGVEIAAESGLAGHSDADVLLHAICDALLGAAGLGDIGEHFPPDDAQFAGADSRDLLRECVRLADIAGWAPIHIDATLVAEAPRIRPHVATMKAAIGACLGLPPTAVGVKATTNEGLGFVGRGEGIAALAVATVAPIAPSSDDPPLEPA